MQNTSNHICALVYLTHWWKKPGNLRAREHLIAARDLLAAVRGSLVPRFPVPLPLLSFPLPLFTLFYLKEGVNKKIDFLGEMSTSPCPPPPSAPLFFINISF